MKSPTIARVVGLLVTVGQLSACHHSAREIGPAGDAGVGNDGATDGGPGGADHGVTSNDDGGNPADGGNSGDLLPFSNDLAGSDAAMTTAYYCAPPPRVLAAPALGSGTSYYVSNSGNDGNGGTSTGAPWKTVAQVNTALAAGTIKAGDSILFARGGLWREQLTLPPSVTSVTGTAANPLTFGAYGDAAALPILSGANVLTDWASTSANSTNYVGAVSTQAAWIFADTTGTTYADSSSQGNALTVAAVVSNSSVPSGFSGTSADLSLHAATRAAAQLSANLPGHAAAASFTIGGWVRLNALGSFASFFDLGDSTHGIHLLTDSGGRFYPVVWTSGKGGVQGSVFPVMKANIWTHVVIRVTAASNLLEVFFNGVKQLNTLTIPSGTLVAAPTADLKFGAGGDTGLFFQWFAANSALPDADVVSIYANGLAAKTINAYADSIGAIAPKQVFANSKRMTPFGQLAGLPLNSFYYDGSAKLYIRTATDVSPVGAYTIEASQRQRAIFADCNSHSDIDFVDLQLQMSNGQGLYNCGGSSYQLYGLTVVYNFDQGLRMDGGPHHSAINDTAAYNGNDGLAFDTTPNLLVSHCLAHDNVQLENQFSAGIKVEPDVPPGSSTNVTIEYSTAYDNGVGLQTPFTGSGIWIDTVGDGALLRGNTVYGNNDMGLNIDASNYATAICNASRTNLIGGIGAYADGQPSMTGHRIIGNTVTGNSGFGIQISGPVAGAKPGGCVDNLVQQNTVSATVGQNFQAVVGCENVGTAGSGNVVTYDNFGTASTNFLEWGAGQLFSTYASWEEAPGNCGSAGCSHCD